MIILSDLEIGALKLLWDASAGRPEFMREIEAEMRKKTAEERFSKEFIYEVCRIKGHALTVYFVPGSDAHSKYGEYVVMDIALDEDELTEMTASYLSKANTYGNVKARILVKSDLTDGQIQQLAKEGFNTIDIFETMHL